MSDTVLFERSLDWLLEHWEALEVKVVDDRYAMVGCSSRYGEAAAQGPLATLETRRAPVTENLYTVAAPHVAGRRFRPAAIPFPLASSVTAPVPFPEVADL